MKKVKNIIVFIFFVGMILSGCGKTIQSAEAENSSLKAENTRLKEENNIVGSYKDNQDKAAIVLNSNGTGRYVYADPTAPDTDDQLTWQKDTDNSFTIKLNDSNVTSPLTGKLSKGKLILSGDSNWNTEIFNKTRERLNLDNFLAKNKSKNESSQTTNSNTMNQSEDTNTGNSHPKLADGTDVYSLPLSDSRNPDSAKQRKLMEIAGDPQYRNSDGSMNDEGRALSSSIQATFHQPQ